MPTRGHETQRGDAAIDFIEHSVVAEWSVAGTARRAVWSMLDQAIYSLTNFALAVFVARAVGEAEFGAFAAVYIIYVLSLSVTEALTAEVFVVVYSAAEPADARTAARVVTGCAFGLGLAVAIAQASVGLIAHGPMASSLGAFAVFIPALFVQDVWRYVFFATGRPRAAVFNDFVWGVLQAAAFVALTLTGRATVGTLVVAWGAAGTVAAAIGVVQVGVIPDPRRTRTWLREHRHLGSRFAGEFLILYGSLQVVFGVVGITRGLVELAQIRTAQLVFGPLQMLLNAGRVGLTAVAVRARAFAPGRLRPVALWTSSGLGAVALIWGTAILLLPQRYGEALVGASWDGARRILPATAVAHVAVALSFGALAALRAVRAARQTFWARGTWGVLILTLGGAGAVVGGASLAAAGIAGANIAGLLILTWYARAETASAPGVEAEHVPLRAAAGRPTGERLPDFLIIGAQRSASTYLSNQIRTHPEVFSPRGEIPYFEDPHYPANDSGSLGRVFRRASVHQICGFKCADLLSRPECPSRIAAAVPDARLIAVLREPIARTVSAYFHYVRSGVLPVMPLNDGLRRILDTSLDKRFPQAHEVVDYGCYGKHLRRYLALFDRDSLLVLLDEDLRPSGARKQTFRRVFDFIGADPNFEPPDLDRRANSGVYSPVRLRLGRLGSRFLYSARDPASGFVRIRTGWFPRAANRLVVTIDRALLAPFVENRPPPLADDVVRELRVRFDADRAELERILDRSIEAWKSATARA